MAWLLPPLQQEVSCNPDQRVGEEDDRPGRVDIWTSIQAKKAAVAEAEMAPPYVHPLLRRSSSLLSLNNLETCTESLGSETGSDAFSSDDDEMQFQLFTDKHVEDESSKEMLENNEGDEEVKELTTVNYHCSVGRKLSPARQFPPPLPSITRRDGPCLSMRPHRRDGRLVVEAVPVPSQNYLQAERHDGRLLLSFIKTAPASAEQPQQQKDLGDPVDHEELVEDEAVAEEEEEEEEVEVVERGTVVEVKVSGGAASKVLRSTLVINKFVGATPVGNQERWAETENHPQQRRSTGAQTSPPLRRTPCAISISAAAAAVAETALSATGSEDVRNYGRLPRLAAQHAASPDNKVLFTSKRRNKEELLHNMRRCSQLRRPLFIWEPYCIATTS